MDVMDEQGPEPGSQSQVSWLSESQSMFLASTITLYFELLVIRYLPSEVRIFTNLKNPPLVASFFGIGLGMILGNSRMRLKTVFPFATALSSF